VTRRLTLLVPGDPDTRTGGYGYDRRIAEGLRERDWAVEVTRLSDTFPFPTPAALAHAAEVLTSLPDDTLVLADGLAFSALPAQATHQARRLRLIALVHHPLASETGLSAGAAAALDTAERAALGAARRVVVTSPGTARAVLGLGVDPGRLAVIEPGTDPATLARGSRSPIPHLLCVASIVPRKGHEILLAALAGLGDRPWHLTCVGSLTRDPGTTARLKSRLTDGHVTSRVRLTGDLDEDGLAAEYDRADLFVLGSLHEGYGMAVAEALARGLPVVATSTGAIADLVGNGAGLIVPPGDEAALREALALVLDDPVLRARLATGALACRSRLPSWDDACTHMATLLEDAGNERCG
jgi:glycosyltransferase involved in cell wall biosynthesis